MILISSKVHNLQNGWYLAQNHLGFPAPDSRPRSGFPAPWSIRHGVLWPRSGPDSYLKRRNVVNKRSTTHKQSPNNGVVRSCEIGELRVTEQPD